MLLYLSDLTEDATDFAWTNTKAAHAVVLCEMERGALTWHDTNRLDRLCRAQRHFVNKQNVGKTDTRKPWYCKLFQSGSFYYAKDHETNGRYYRHICAHCLSLGKTFSRTEKDCKMSRK